MMYDHEKSDPAIVAVKLTNKAGQPAADLVGAKGGGRGECELAKHGPGTVPGNRVTGAEAHTARCDRTDLCGGREVTRVPTANIQTTRAASGRTNYPFPNEKLKSRFRIRKIIAP